MEVINVSVATFTKCFGQSDHKSQQYRTGIQTCKIRLVRSKCEAGNQTHEGEKQSGGRLRGWKCEKSQCERQWVKSAKAGIQLPISCRQQAAVLTMLADSRLPLTTNHSFCIVNKQFKRKCQQSDRKRSSGYNVSFLLPVYAVAAWLPGKWWTGWVMRMACTTCSVGGDSNEGWHDAFYRPSRQCGLTQYFSHLLSKCWSVMDLTTTYKRLMGENGGNGDKEWHPLVYPYRQSNHRDAKNTPTLTDPGVTSLVLCFGISIAKKRWHVCPPKKWERALWLTQTDTVLHIVLTVCLE